jgi:hypothetical protein
VDDTGRSPAVVVIVVVIVVVVIVVVVVVVHCRKRGVKERNKVRGGGRGRAIESWPFLSKQLQQQQRR